MMLTSGVFSNPDNILGTTYKASLNFKIWTKKFMAVVRSFELLDIGKNVAFQYSGKMETNSICYTAVILILQHASLDNYSVSVFLIIRNISLY